MVALGCKYLRICHLNNCATGVATQHAALRRRHFIGLPEMVENYFRFVAREVREIMASLGVRRFDDLVGRTRLLRPVRGDTPRQAKLDLSPLLSDGGLGDENPQVCTLPRNEPFDEGPLAERMVAETRGAIEERRGGTFHYARLSGEIARRWGNYQMEEDRLVLQLKGSAGQSFGVWNVGGLHMYLEGDANDYVGKGMAGGRLVLFPPTVSRFKASETPIMGNTCLYGATGGQLFAAGRAGERFAVRNSGAVAVVEGLGDHGCEYMTGGIVVVLGQTGRNFAAGMSGGIAYVLDESEDFPLRCNMAMVELEPIADEDRCMEELEHQGGDLEGHGKVDLVHDMTRHDALRLRGLIERHQELTGSERAAEILADWNTWMPKFVKIMPVEYRRALEERQAASRASERSGISVAVGG